MCGIFRCIKNALLFILLFFIDTSKSIAGFHQGINQMHRNAGGIFLQIRKPFAFIEFLRKLFHFSFQLLDLIRIRRHFIQLILECANLGKILA